MLSLYEELVYFIIIVKNIKIIAKKLKHISMPFPCLSAQFPVAEVWGIESCAVQSETLMEVLQNSQTGGVEISGNPTWTSSRTVIKRSVLTCSPTSLNPARAVPGCSAGTHHHGNRYKSTPCSLGEFTSLYIWSNYVLNIIVRTHNVGII